MDTGFTAAQLGTQLTTAAQGVLPYIGVGVAAGVIVLAVTWGIRKGVGFAKGIGK